MTVDVDMIATALGRTTPESWTPEYAQWDMWIGDALMLILARVTSAGIEGIDELDDLDQTQLDYVVREAVVAQVRRPDDATTVDVRVDDGAVAKTYRSGAGRVTIRDEWWNLLFPADSTSGAFSIRPSGSCSIHADICSANYYTDTNGALVYGGAYCSCGADIAGYPLYEVGY